MIIVLSSDMEIPAICIILVAVSYGCVNTVYHLIRNGERVLIKLIAVDSKKRTIIKKNSLFVWIIPMILRRPLYVYQFSINT